LEQATDKAAARKLICFHLFGGDFKSKLACHLNRGQAFPVNLFNMTDANNNPPKRWRRAAAMALVGMAISWCLCACVHRDADAGREAEDMLPKLRAMMTGPTALLLTNLGGFQSECVISLADANGTLRNYSGRLFARGGKLRLETVPGKSKSASTHAFGVIWDAAASRGYVFSDALQGYAVLAGSDRFTNLLTSAVGQPEKLEGHAVDSVDVTAIGVVNQKMVLQLNRAQDLGNLPMQIRKPDETNSFALRLTKVQEIVPPEELFLPPDGFTKYESETALLDELLTRQRSVFESKQERVLTHEGPDDRGGQHRSGSNGP
jgi:hypothetical protein